MSCGECQKIWANLWHSVPDCSVCDYPGLWPENFSAYQIYYEGGDSLYDDRGGINLINAKLVCETLGYTWDIFIMKKIIAVITARHEWLEEDRRQRENINAD